MQSECSQLLVEMLNALRGTLNKKGESVAAKTGTHDLNLKLFSLCRVWSQRVPMLATKPTKQCNAFGISNDPT